MTSLNSASIISISSGADHTFILCKDGLFCYGSNKYGQLALNNTIQTTPIKTKFEKVKLVACGYNHSFVVCEGGVFAFGYNRYGQLGIGNNVEQQSTPIKLDFDPENVLNIVCGGNHTFFITKDHIYACGFNECGQLGLGDTINQNTLTKTLFKPENIVNIVCGFSHTIIHCKDGIFTFGYNQQGQLGLGNTESMCFPQKTQFSPDNVISITTGSHHVFVHCKDGVYAFGINTFGQLGIGNTDNQLKPVKTIFNPDKVLAIVCGGYHTIVFCDDGLYTFGCNENGQLGLGHQNQQIYPIKSSFQPENIILLKQLKSIEYSKEHQLKQFMKNLLICGDYSDFNFRNFKLHKAFISIRCPQILKEYSHIYDYVSENILNNFFHWVYTNTFDSCPSLSVLLELISFSQLIGIKEMVEYSTKLVLDLLNDETVYEILLSSAKLGLEKTSDWCIWHIINKNLDIPSNVIAGLPPAIIAQLLSKCKTQLTLLPPSIFVNSQTNMREVFCALFRDQDSADCIITVNGKDKLYLHKFVLAPQWKYFESIMKQQNFSTKLPLSALTKIIEYFYFGIDYIPMSDAYWIISCADEYLLSDEEQLMNLCNESKISGGNWKETFKLYLDIPNEMIEKMLAESMPTKMTNEEIIFLVSNTMKIQQQKIQIIEDKIHHQQQQLELIINQQDEKLKSKESIIQKQIQQIQSSNSIDQQSQQIDLSKFQQRQQELESKINHQEQELKSYDLKFKKQEKQMEKLISQLDITQKLVSMFTQK